MGRDAERQTELQHVIHGRFVESSPYNMSVVKSYSAIRVVLELLGEAQLEGEFRSPHRVLNDFKFKAANRAHDRLHAVVVRHCSSVWLWFWTSKCLEQFVMESIRCCVRACVKVRRVFVCNSTPLFVAALRNPCPTVPFRVVDCT
jgi:hypothetical protein